MLKRTGREATKVTAKGGSATNVILPTTKAKE